MTTMHTIKTKAIQLLQDPDRKWGRNFNQTLSDTVGAALVKATASAPLASADFEQCRSEILKSFREGRAC
jgi:hypothetical protein